ncbi:FecR domain-containing protein [Belliella sp. DSM 111904]|uniref:FecR domain-containing protein n=1 Tax=Belliella filtrata TaxID=2923435 RepID=A0ABS9V389_9BACT|nr:FecR family protein [Belliella filtrata]MCH7410438.1 FecR domain-containing protein [Belliella filtrata]
MKNQFERQKAIQILIAKSLRGKLDLKEKEILDHWYEQQGDKVIYKGSIEKKLNKKRAFKKVEKKLFGSNPKIPFWIKVAASIVCISMMMYLLSNSIQTQEAGTNDYNLGFRKIENENGMRKQVILSDGSKVLLNGKSTLSIRQNFAKERIVFLSGEAFFEVMSDSLKPFRVFTDLTITEVLGTTFSIKTHGAANEKIAVNQGKVKVTSKSQDHNQNIKSKTLNASEAVEYSLTDGLSKVNQIDPKTTFGWVNGVLYFENKPILEVLETLAGWYGLEETDFSQVNTDCKVTGSYTKVTLKEILESIKYATEINYELNGKKLKVKQGKCKG